MYVLSVFFLFGLRINPHLLWDLEKFRNVFCFLGSIFTAPMYLPKWWYVLHPIEALCPSPERLKKLNCQTTNINILITWHSIANSIWETKNIDLTNYKKSAMQKKSGWKKIWKMIWQFDLSVTQMLLHPTGRSPFESVNGSANLGLDWGAYAQSPPVYSYH